MKKYKVLTLSLRFMSAPASTSNVTTSSLPHTAATCRAVIPPLYVQNNDIMIAVILQYYLLFNFFALLFYIILFDFIIFIYILIRNNFILQQILTEISNLFEILQKKMRWVFKNFILELKIYNIIYNIYSQKYVHIIILYIIFQYVLYYNIFCIGIDESQYKRTHNSNYRDFVILFDTFYIQ